MNEKICGATHQEPKSVQPRGRQQFRRYGTLGLLSLTLGIIGLSLTGSRRVPDRDASDLRSWKSLYAKLPLSFEANRGQTDSRAKYLARGQGYTLFLTAGEAVLSFNPSPQVSSGPSSHSLPGAVLRLGLMGAAPSVQMKGEDQLPGYSNYFLGNNPRQWYSRVPTYARVRYESIYPGIDLIYYGHQGQLENDFILSAGADPKLIRLGLKGVDSMNLDANGDLELKVGREKVCLERPRAYQEIEVGRQEVTVRFALRAGKELGFSLGPYDHRHELVIDPVLKYATYLGGGGGDVGYGIAVDSSGNAYVTGITNSTNFPTTSGAVKASSAGSGDVFVTKINPAGTKSTSSSTPQLAYSTYLGGAGTDSGAAIAVNAGGDAFVTGSTTSTDFPTTSGVFQGVYEGAGDAFVAQLNSTGSALVYASYLGGSGADFGLGIAIDSANNAYVTGSTQSVDFPTVGPLQPTNQGSSDAFVAKVNFAATQLLYSTYLGGTAADVAQSIQVDNSGNAFLTGYTFSQDFPLQNPIQGANAGTVNAFVSELNSAGSLLTFSTYLGGSGSDRAYGLTLDKSGNIYIAGGTQSGDFPTTTGVFQINNQGNEDAFVAKVNPSGPTLVYSSFLGGGGTDQANGIAVDSSGDVFVTGFTNSSDFPTESPIQAILGINGGSACGTAACSDAFVSELNPTGTGLIESTYLGGNGADFGQGIALNTNGNPYITGSTSSTNFPAIAGNYPAYQSSLAGPAGNAFVAEITPSDAPGISIVPATMDFGNQTESVRSAVKSVAITNEGTAPLTISQITFAETDSTGNTDFAETDNCVGTVGASGGTCTVNITFTPRSLTTETGTFSITDNASGSPHEISVTGKGVTAATDATVTPSSLSFGNITVGDASSAQTVTLTNTGTETLNITSISTSGDFSQTNTCSALLNVLNVGQSCNISVTFAPTVSGSRAGALTISDNASSGSQAVVLSGVGVAVFSMSSPTPNVSVLIGNTTAQFTITASAPDSFTGSITLTCPSSLTCSWSSKNIFAGQTSTLTVSDITTSMAKTNPYAFSVTGTSGSQSATVNLNMLFQDYTLAASPALNTIVAGAAASYTIAINPINGFSKQVQLACGTGMPSGATCSFSNSSVVPSDGPASVTLKIQTTKTGMSPPPPAEPPRAVPPLIFSLLVLFLLGSLLLARKRSRYPSLAAQRWVRLQVCTLCLVILSGLFVGACRAGSTTSSTTTGNYSITISGTLGSNSSVVRSTIINLAVTCPSGASCS